MKQITITIAGVCCTGKSLLKYQIAKHLQSLGLNNVSVVENEMNISGALARTNTPSMFVESMNESGVCINIEEKQLARDLTSKEELYFIPGSKKQKYAP